MPVPPSPGGLPVRAIGIPWYRREQYGRVLRVMADAASLPGSYAAWLARAQAVEQQLQAQGHVTERVHLDPGTFPGWCRARGLDVDAQARMAFANLAIAERYRDQG